VKLVQVITGILAIVFWFSSFSLFDRYDSTSPTKPDVASGAIYSQENHGHVVYLTAGEKDHWYELMAAAGVSFAISGLLSVHLALIKGSGRDQ